MMHIAFVLVEPKRPENVGAAARAIHTMGFGDLRLVGEPLQLSPQARALAHGSSEVLSSARNFPTLELALEDIDLVIGTSAKQRYQRRYHHSPEQLRDMLQQKQQTLSSAALLFGREECGLSTDTIALCDLVTQIPLAAPQPSLNLAQAVMVYSYSLSKLALARNAGSADSGQFRALKPKLGALLLRAGITDEEKPWRWAMERLAAAGDEDIKFLHFICDKIDRQGEN